MNFIEKLNMLMKEKKIKDRGKLAKGAGIPYNTVLSWYLNGYKNIRLQTLRQLALYLDCSLDYLANDKITDRNYKPFNINDLSPSESKMVETYIRAKGSANPTVKTLVDLIDKELGINGHTDER